MLQIKQNVCSKHCLSTYAQFIIVIIQIRSYLYLQNICFMSLQWIIALYRKNWKKNSKISNCSSSSIRPHFHHATGTMWKTLILCISSCQWHTGSQASKEVYEGLKIGLLHKNGVIYEIHANLAIFKKSKNGQKPHESKNYLTSCFTKVQRLDLGWSDFKFGISVNPPTSSLWDPL